MKKDPRTPRGTVKRDSQGRIVISSPDAKEPWEKVMSLQPSLDPAKEIPVDRPVIKRRIRKNLAR